MRLATSVISVLAVITLAACGGDGGAPTAGGSPVFTPAAELPADAHTVRIRAGEFFFDPADVTLPAGQPVALTLQNFGQVEHDWLALTEDELAIVDAYVYADAGETTTGVFELEAGTYTVICTIEGHRAAGMEGTVTAE
jgi:plastocyanin